jgi:uncharacterized membrane protein
VFAIVITLAVFSIKIPDLAPSLMAFRRRLSAAPFA